MSTPMTELTTDERAIADAVIREIVRRLNAERSRDGREVELATTSDDVLYAIATALEGKS